MASNDMVEWVDENDAVIQTVLRLRAHDEGLLHRVSVVYLARQNGDILIQQRKSGRYDHSSAGHVDVGETYEQAAARELFEELGVRHVVLTKIGKTSNEEKRPEKGSRVRHVFTVFECESEPVKLAESEVMDVRWESPLKIWEDMQRDPNEEKYTGGFKSTLQLYLATHKLR